MTHTLQHHRRDGETARLPSLGEVKEAFNRASKPQKLAIVGAGVVVACSAPYWVPVVRRSKVVRSLLAMGANAAIARLMMS